MWDVTCPDTFAPCRVGLVSGGVGLAVAQAEQQKNRSYFELLDSHHLPISLVSP